MLNLAALHTSGDGIEKDEKQAAAWLLRAAELGDGLAQAKLGVVYRAGDGVRRDLVKAHMWLSLSDNEGADEWRELVERQLSPYEQGKSKKLVREWKRAHDAAAANTAP